MNYIGNVEFEKIDENLFLAKNSLIGIMVMIFNGNTNIKQENLYLYKQFNVRDGKETNYGFFKIEQLKSFIFLKEKTKGISTSLLAEFSCLSEIDKKLIIENKKTIKGLGKANIDKIKNIYVFEDLEEINSDKYHEIQMFLEGITDDKKEIEIFLSLEFQNIKNLSKIEILEKFKN